MAAILFDPHLSHVLGFRHGPRAARPPDGDVWDFEMMLSEQAPAIATRTVAAYFPKLEPAMLRCSPIPRSRKTLELLWPGLSNEIEEDPRLGLRRGDEQLWKAIDVRGAYDMTPQEMFASARGIVEGSGRSFLAAALDLAFDVGIGAVGALCSHSPFADVAARLARLELGITENDGWLPGSGFQSGAFLHLAYDARGALELCRYYPAPEA